ncbi:MAG: hypothetical protein NVV63_13625 [Opitutus sp.]|nr:hypothetical protein [Opitutus sp.]
MLAERSRIASETKLSPDQIDFLQGQLSRLDSLTLTDDAIAALERDFARMNRAQELIELTGTLSNGLVGEEGLQVTIASLLREARHLENIDPASKPLADRLASVAVEINDLGAEFSDLGQQLQFDPEQAEELATQMNTWLEFKRKHGGDLAAVLAARDEMRRRLEVQGDIEGTLARLEKQIADAERAARKSAQALRAIREKAARDLAKVAAKSIAEIGFKKADFKVRLVPLETLGPSGDCGAEFLFSPNVGEPPLPLNRVASSGELARVMLALKTVLADLDDVPLLVFDEVDANVGGEIGRIVGEKMATIAKNHQVLCVTHLPQVAAQAGVTFRGHQGSVEGPRGGHDRADPRQSQNARERTRPHARRPQREERTRARRRTFGQTLTGSRRARVRIDSGSVASQVEPRSGHGRAKVHPTSRRGAHIVAPRCVPDRDEERTASGPSPARVGTRNGPPCAKVRPDSRKARRDSISIRRKSRPRVRWLQPTSARVTSQCTQPLHPGQCFTPGSTHPPPKNPAKTTCLLIVDIVMGGRAVVRHRGMLGGRVQWNKS